jgi:hypothetical protein
MQQLNSAALIHPSAWNSNSRKLRQALASTRVVGTENGSGPVLVEGLTTG